MFGKKPKKRGPYRSAEVRAKETQARMNEHLARVYLEDLKAHPEYARQVAREKFGMPEMRFGEDSGGGVPDLITQVREMREIRQEMAEEFGSGEESLGKTLVKGLLPLLPQLAASLKGQPIQIEQPEQAPQIEARKPSSVEEQQAALLSYIERMLAAEPEEVAAEIYQFRDQPQDIRGIMWRYACEYEFEDLLEMIDAVPKQENYRFLAPLLAGLSKPERKKWLALVYDSLNKLKTAETPSETGEIQ